MVSIPFRLVDVFGERPLEGNQLCVLPDSPDLDAGLVQKLAREIGFSETTWVLEANPAGYRMRIFTPTTEMPFAGHPSLGTAHVLASLGRTGPRPVQTVEAGEFQMAVDLEAGESRMRQRDPVVGPAFADVAAVAAAVGLKPADLESPWPIRPVDTGLNQLIVPAATEDAVRRADPHGHAIRDVLDAAGGVGIYLFASETPGKALSRYFGPGVGVDEDPATGSAAGPLGAYLAEHAGLRGRLTIRQGEQIGRPSVLRVDVDDGVWVLGRVHAIAEGAFELPDA